MRYQIHIKLKIMENKEDEVMVKEKSETEKFEEKKKKQSTAIYRMWLKNKEIRKRQIEKEKAKLLKRQEYVPHHMLLKKYYEMKVKHDRLEKKYSVLNMRNQQFMKDYMMYYKKERKQELTRVFRSLSRKYIDPSCKDFAEPCFNLFSPLLENTKSFLEGKEEVFETLKDSSVQLVKKTDKVQKESKDDKRSEFLPKLVIKKSKRLLPSFSSLGSLQEFPTIAESPKYRKIVMKRSILIKQFITKYSI
eukprot:TRINITY_DN927_c0_g1_i3.p2 TRINITY_DN927_c0_g1~~TRINITY_DN927_c0_g1_i3.p2  ORF type:complete len:248 (+),score=49.95 TRINITY_DN927_c0_g1_i3:1233-1976(+)